MAKGRYQRLDHAQVWAFYSGGTRGALGHELTGYLRTRRVMRRPSGTNPLRGKTMDQLRDMVHIRHGPHP